MTPDMTNVMRSGAAPARPMGDRAALIECPGAVPAVAQALHHARTTGTLSGISEIVPAARTVLVCCDDWASVQSVIAWAKESSASPGDLHVPGAEARLGDDGRLPGRTVDIDVMYDGEDLVRVAEHLGMSLEALVAAHTAAGWSAAFGGFAPGFMYLAAQDWPHRLPRLDAPRERVAAGAVALAGEFSAVYPGSSPGGWQLIGRTNAQLWSLDRAEPALVRPGDAVRFWAMRELVRATDVKTSGGRPATGAAGPAGERPGIERAPGTVPAFTVLRPGVLTLIQDAGRGGYRAVGVTESGAMDRSALARANASVGNPAGAAALEVVAGGLELRVERQATVAIAGSAARLEIREAGECRVVAAAMPVDVTPGQRLTLNHVGPGARDYLAVGGGILGLEAPRGTEAPEASTLATASRSWLGSRSSDTLSGIGPRRLTAGDAVLVGDKPAPASSEGAGPGVEATLTQHEGARPEDSAITVLRLLPGPRDDWFTSDASRALARATWTVSAQADRVGARLEGPALERTPAAMRAELPSEGMVRGAVQVPPNGEPVLFLADHPVTGGYPVIGVVLDADLDRAGQLAPGDPVRFALVDPGAGEEEGAWPQPAPAAATGAGDTALRPTWVTCTLEIDGRRHAIRIPGALAAALDRVWGAEHGTDLQAPYEPNLAEAAREMLAGVVRAIRSEVGEQPPPGQPEAPARVSRTD